MKTRDDVLTIDMLSVSRERLSQELIADIPGKELEWAKKVGWALTSVDRALRQHQSQTEGSDGVFAQADLTRPSLARKAGDLQQEHVELIHEAGSLLSEVQRAAQAFQLQTKATEADLPQPSRNTGIPDFATICERVDKFLETLRHHQEEEAALALESVTTDIGAGD